MQQRVHTFGVGNGASEELIKNCAFKGLGHYYFVYNEDEIEEKVVQSLAKQRMNYQTLKSIKLFDEEGKSIETQLNHQTAPIVDNGSIQLIDLLERGV